MKTEEYIAFCLRKREWEKRQYVRRMYAVPDCENLQDYSHDNLKHLRDETIQWMSQDHALPHWIRLQLALELYRRDEALPRDLVRGIREYLLTLPPLATGDILGNTSWVWKGCRLVPLIEPYEGKPGDWPEPYNVPKNKRVPDACDGSCVVGPIRAKEVAPWPFD